MMNDNPLYDAEADYIAEAIDETTKATKEGRRLKPEIDKNTVVAFKDGYYRVKSRFTNTVNLCGVFDGKIRHKSVPVTLMREAHDEWYDTWSKSESYMCM